jgi:hypothetical protein
MQHVIGCESIHIIVDIHQLSIQLRTSAHRELSNQCIPAWNGNVPWVTKQFYCTVSQIDHCDAVSCGMFIHRFCDNHPQEWTKQTFNTIKKTTEVYMLEVIAESQFWK